MSMIARFVQTAPDLLTRLIAEPSLAPGLLQLNGASSAGESAHDGGEDSTEDSAEDGDNLRRPSPKLVDGSMSRLEPAPRDGLTRRLESRGVSFGSGGARGLKSILAQRAAQRAQQNEQPPYPPPAESNGSARQPTVTTLSLEKAWHGVHYLLCGETDAGEGVLSQAVLGGVEFGEDLGYGPARYFAPAKVALIASELTRDDLEAEMKARFDPAQMSRAGIYPRLWAPAEADWLMEEFRRLREFYASAAAADFAVVTCIV